LCFDSETVKAFFLNKSQICWAVCITDKQTEEIIERGRFRFLVLKQITFCPSGSVYFITQGKPIKQGHFTSQMNRYMSLPVKVQMANQWHIEFQKETSKTDI